MRITECVVENFGKLSSERYTFESGLNSILADNGQGKSTLAAFICAMFYGLSDTRKQSLEENDRKKYTPWSGGAFGGSITFDVNGELFRVERRFGKKASEDSFVLYDAESGRRSDRFSEALGEELFGIDADGFLRTVFLSEKTLSEKNDNKSIGAKLSGIAEVEADMKELDNALAILEEQRKIYQRKGGAGVIADTRARAAELDEQIAEAKKKELELASAEEELQRITEALERVEKEKAAFNEARTVLENERRVKTYKTQYDNMLRGLAADEEKCKKLTQFFAAGKPTYEEIDEARMKQMEFERVFASSDSVKENAELAELKAFFKNGVTAEETDRMYDLVLSIDATEAEEKEHVPSEFSLRTPTVAELEREAHELKRARAAKNRRPLALIPLSVGAVLGLTALILGSASAAFIPLLSVFALLLAASIAVVITGDPTKRKKAAERKASDFILSVSGRLPTGDALEELEKMLTSLLTYKSTLDASTASEKKRKDREETLREIYAYLSKFPAPTSKTLIGAISEIKDKHKRLDVLLLAEEQLMKDLGEKQREASLKMEEVALFLSRFKTVTDRPFDEIRDALTEFNTLSTAIVTKRKELDDFARMNGIDDISWEESVLTENEIDDGRKSAEEKIFALSKEKILLERRIESDKAVIEHAEELRAIRQTLDTDEKKFEKNLDIIQKTKKYLTEAHEKMTRRYLDKTKSSFMKYVSSIGSSTGEFVLDTDFTLTKYEGAVARKTESYSKGTRDLYLFALRLALTESLYEKDVPFIILDDPFMSFDDKTLSRAKSALREIGKTRQIIYFTCSEARAV